MSAQGYGVREVVRRRRCTTFGPLWVLGPDRRLSVPVKVGGRRNRVAKQCFGSVVGPPDVGILSGGAQRMEVRIAETRLGSLMWGCFRNKKERRSPLQEGQKA